MKKYMGILLAAVILLWLANSFGIWDAITGNKDSQLYFDGSNSYGRANDWSDTYQMSADSMFATVNGTACEFDLESVVWRGGDIVVTYVCFNPRGDILYTVSLYLDENIEMGKYNSSNGNTEFSVRSGKLTAQSEVTGFLMGEIVTVREGAGSFSLNLSYRSDDWKTYEGTFSATLGRTSLSGSYGDSSMTIQNAQFNFTLQ